MNKRLFTAINLSPDYLSALADYNRGFDLKGIRWTVENNLHITVHFFGDTKEEKIPLIISALESVAQNTEIFSLKSNQIILAPPERIPNMIWATFHGEADFQKLATETYRSTKNFLFEIQEPKFLPHITLARFKGFVDLKKINLKPIDLPDLKVDGFKLMASELLPEGPIYTVLGEFRLKLAAV